MSVAALLRDLERRGVELAVDGEALTMRAPKGVLDDADRAVLRARKSEILAWLRGDAAADRQDGQPFPLTDIQEAYLVGRAAEMELGRVGCHAYREFEADGFDLARLELAWNRLVDRHPMLRAVIIGEQQQVLDEVPTWRIPVLDLRGRPEAEERLEALRAERSHHLFDPAVWPLFDIRLTLLDDRSRLHVGLDLLIADAVSMVQLFREWGMLYRDPDALLPKATASFAQHCRASRRRAAPAAENYWNARLPELPGGPDLPRQPLKGPPRFARRSHKIAAPAWSALKNAANERGITPSVLLAAAYGDILAAWSRSRHFLIVLTTFAAPPQMAEVVGDFTSTILLEVDASLPDFAGRAAALQRRLAQDLDHAQISGVRVMRDLRRHRPDITPATAVFTSTLGHRALEGDPPLAWLGRTVHAITQTPQVAIDHHVVEEQGDLLASWDVVADLFPPGVVEGMFSAYGRLLAALASGEGWSASLGATMDRPARPAPVAAFTPAPLFADLLHQAARAPEQPAVIDGSGTLQFGELARISAIAAGRLRALGAGPEKLVAVELPKSWQQVAASLAVLRAGAAYLPLDPDLPASRRTGLLAATGALVPDWAALLDGQGAVPDLPAVDPASLAYVIFTSGSTGQPKGVMIEHGAALNTLHDLQRRWPLLPSDRVLGLSALSFDLSVYDLFGVLGAGGALVLPDAAQRRDPSAWAELIVQRRVTVWNSVPALAAMLAEHGLPEGHGLRLFLLSGDWIPLELVPRLQALAPGADLVALGGATEASIWSNFQVIDGPEPGWSSVPYGQPLANQTMQVVDAQGAPCPDWVVGEIEIGGLGLARGYWGDPARTAERFGPNPASGQRRYRTGDLGRFRPGNRIEFLGREDFQVKVQGHRIELGEIEAHLLQHPAVHQAVAAALPAPGHQHHKTLHAFVVAKEGEADKAEPADLGKAVLVLERPGRRKLDGRLRMDLAERGPASAFARRRSVRRFAPRPTPRAAFDEMLGRLAGEQGDLVRQRYPSAGSLYAVQTHLVVKPGRIEGVAGGVYYHDPVDHALVRLNDGLPACMVAHPPTARAVNEAAFLVLLIADLAVMRPTYGDAARDFCLLEAGYIGQLLMNDLDPQALGLLPVGGLQVDDLATALDLTPDQVLVHALAGGVPDESEHPEGLAVRLRRHLAKRLPDYMVPRRITLVPGLPLSANGKVDRQALEVLAEPLPADRSDHPETAAIRGLVAEILGSDAVNDRVNLFDLGATSLHLVRLQRRLAELHGERAPAMVDLFRLPTVADIARQLAESPPGPVADAGLSRAQRRLEARGRAQTDGRAKR